MSDAEPRARAPDGAPSPAPPPWRRHAPLFAGLWLCVALAVAGHALSKASGAPVAPLTLALALVAGPFLRRGRLPESLDHVQDLPLGVGMILLGVQVDAATLACLGPWAPLRTLLHWLVVAWLFRLAARPAGLPERTTALVGVGLSGCGLSAVLACSRGDPSVTAGERALAVALTLACGAIAFGLLPAIANALGFSDCALAEWAGLALPTTAEAVLIGGGRSPAALQSVGAWRILVNLLQGLPVVLWLRRHGPPGRARGVGPIASETLRRVPPFVWGLLAFALLGLFGAFTAAERRVLGALTSWAFLTALAAVGLRLRGKDLLGSGWRPLVACILAWATAAALTAMRL